MKATLRKADNSVLRVIGESTDIYALVNAIRKDIPIMLKEWGAENDFECCSRVWDYFDDAIIQLKVDPANAFWCGTGIASMMYIID